MLNNAHFSVWNGNIAGLAWSFTVNPASCDNPEFYSEYLRFSALDDQRDGRGTTHALIDEAQNRIMGFVTLRASSLLSNSGQTLLGRPAIEISMLAVDKDHERRGVGTALIELAIAEAAILRQEHLGVRCIMLAADHHAVLFYEKQGFNRLSALYEMPYENWSANCIPMLMELRF